MAEKPNVVVILADYDEGGVHVPFIASWPGKIKAGMKYDFPVISLDISRTAGQMRSKSRE